MIFYGLNNCDTCRKALKTLSKVEFRDVRSDGVPRAVLKSAYAQFEGKLVNTRSTTWCGLSAEERDADPIDLLIAYPTLMKRPLIEQDGTLYLGWTKEVQVALGV